MHLFAMPIRHTTKQSTRARTRLMQAGRQGQQDATRSDFELLVDKTKKSCCWVDGVVLSSASKRLTSAHFSIMRDSRWPILSAFCDDLVDYRNPLSIGRMDD